MLTTSLLNECYDIKSLAMQKGTYQNTLQISTLNTMFRIRFLIGVIHYQLAY